MGQAEKEKKLRNAAIAFGLMLVVLAVVALETIPRLFPEYMPAKVRAVQRIYSARGSWENMMRGDSELGFVLKPDLDFSFPSEGRQIPIRTVAMPNSDIGHRDIGTVAPFEAIALGDSFTFCDDAPAEACWVKHLSDELGMSIATLGTNGYSNLAELRLLEKVPGRFDDAKIVFVGFFLNDFKDNVHFNNWAQSGTDHYWTWMRRQRRSDVSEGLAKHSILYRLFDAARRYGKRETHEHREAGLDFVFRADAWWRAVMARPGDTPGYDFTVEALKAMKAKTDAMGAKLVVLLFPFKEQVYWDIARGYTRGGEEIEEADIDAPMAAVRTFLEDEGIFVCDLTPDLRRVARQGRQIYLRVGAHWNDEGNAEAARSIAGCLGDQGIVPR